MVAVEGNTTKTGTWYCLVDLGFLIEVIEELTMWSDYVPVFEGPGWERERVSRAGEIVGLEEL